MPKVIADLFQRQPFGEQLGGAGVTKRMWPVMFEWNAKRSQPVGDQPPNYSSTDRSYGRLQRDKKFAIRTLRAHLFQVAKDSFSDRMRERIGLCPLHSISPRGTHNSAQPK